MAVIRFTSRIKSWAADTDVKLDLAVLQMVTDIDRAAKILAPRASGALINSGYIRKNGQGNYSVVFGGGPVPYARRRHFENKKTPSSLRYLQKAGDATSRNAARYFKGV